MANRLLFFILLSVSVLQGCALTQPEPEPPKKDQLSPPRGAYDELFDLPKLPSPERYGNILISRMTANSTHPPVTFSHWLHRRYYTCRVCHFELNFGMKVNSTDITESKIRKGEYCGACHNDSIAFGVNESTCLLCHTGNIGSTDERFSELNGMPQAAYGDLVNWSKALSRGLISPKQSLLDEKFESISFENVLRLEPEWRAIQTRAVFPHQKHTAWLDCADCHPDIFNIQKKGTKHFRMNLINSGKFCGVCHLTVAFPVQDCCRCHPDLRGGMQSH
jgi:c(7)-type cytochrome triheme protein